MAGLNFVLGGARSGKSTYALEWAAHQGERVLFVATAQATDEEMAERIRRHRAERPPHWDTLEAPLNTGQAIIDVWSGQSAVVVDCLTLLAANALLSLPEDAPQQAADDSILAQAEGLLRAYRHTQANWLIVSNEVGMGVVPPTYLGRVYRDALGRANQHIARAADEVYLLVAGIPWRLKSR
ncbi:MAG: bifunctional adenosylcobinamide kinase/adenosylcobinamide-phosphate guanylyltransferase [Anaerolineae bacterium]|nr:bifunctional adenosylcobinamide kinase/adenosylcobinamide-phosphate guanylyltransferase [Anaerolineae bacterium]MDW8171161.1 bifunctional adenosylcobinamide kinase/adenosylcobinamide-phosphate guanylyltransferase [Anaerolineae bacterium]